MRICVGLFMHLSVTTHNLLMTFVPRSFADGIDVAVETFATHLKDSRVTKLKMKRCWELSPNHIATLCRGLHWNRSLEELYIEYDSLPEKVRLIGLLVIATFSVLSVHVQICMKVTTS